MGFPETRWRTFGMEDFILFPSPAARTMEERFFISQLRYTNPIIPSSISAVGKIFRASPGAKLGGSLGQIFPLPPAQVYPRENGGRAPAFAGTAPESFPPQ